MAVLKIVQKLYQEKIPEKLKEEISLVTTGEAKYYNRLYKFFQYTDIQCTADINYESPILSILLLTDISHICIHFYSF